jgi:hypothetical protein
MRGLRRSRANRQRLSKGLQKAARAERIFKEFQYKTRQSWSCERRVVAKAEHLSKGPNPRFIVTSLTSKTAAARELYEKIYCARGEMDGSASSP